MKIQFKSALALILCLLVFGANAQKKDLQSAKNRLNSGDYAEALNFINKAFETGKINERPDAWKTKFLIYAAIAKEQPDLEPNAKQEAYDALDQMLSINPKYDLINMAPTIGNYLNDAYNDGVKAIQNENWKAAMQDFQNFNNLYKLTKNTLYMEAAVVDTMDAQAELYKGYAFNKDGDTKQAIAIYESLEDNAYLTATDKQSIMKNLIDLYASEGDDAKVEALFDRLQKENPGNEFVINEQINYYSNKGEKDKLLKKLNEGLASDPNNSTYNYYKGILLSNMAFPPEGDAPADADDLAKQASEALELAAKSDPDNSSIEYMQGFIYYNQAVAINSKISSASNSEVAGLQRQRSIYFQQALPYMEGALDKLKKSKPGELDNNQMNTAYNVSTALKSIYGLDNQKEKIDEVNNFMSEYNIK